MAHMPNAPLIYTLGLVRFPRVPEFEQFPDKFFAQIRKQYPYDEKFNQATMRADFGPNGITMHQDNKLVWQYLSENKDCGFLLGDEMICFHTSNYIDSKKFLERFLFGLTRLVAIKELGLNLVTAIGIRYLDLVVPQEGKALSEYLQDWVIPKENPVEGVSIQEGAYLAKYRTEIGTLNFQAIRNPVTLFPPDLQSPFLQKNGWFVEAPQVDEFAVIDTDHHAQLSEANNKFDPDSIVKMMDELHTIPKKIFESLGTPEAIRYWKGE